jgi:SAM-dependent methyltransferase
MTRVEEQFEEQRASNTSGVPYFEAFQRHRQEVTRLIVGPERALEEGAEGPTGRGAEGPRGRCCVLGAGNANDLELERLLDAFAELHLVDIDPEALGRAKERAPEAMRERLFLHAPIDLSGIFSELPRWAQMQVTLRELMAAPAVGAQRIAQALPGPFDVVASTCLLTQLQLSLLGVIGDRHRLFVPLRELLTLTHLRTLAQLTRPGGRALLVTDLCEGSVFPAGRPRDDADVAQLMLDLLNLGHVIHSSHPALLKLPLADDPILAKSFGEAGLSAPWIWHNGPERRFLCYALALPRKG